ncbi:hypothetical protein [Rhizobium sp. AN80A]|uniref:hypothetical protein n=1 Tax=Rhizobium sp. AN80A TaxID=3040673 RepID=UPI0024B35BCE|nr:hypothetical protein [Rhizobium sp. AN80A]
MNGTVAQLAALACHGNAHLKNGGVPSFFPSNSTCKFCDEISFVVFKRSFFGKVKEKEIASTPDDWFEYLTGKNAKSLKLAYSPQSSSATDDRMSAGFVGGGGRWGIEVLLPNDKSEYWVARWQVWNQNAPERRIWRVTYAMVSTGKTPRDGALPIRNVTDALERSLEEIHSFSERNNCGGFTEAFAKALDTLRSGNKHGYHQDISRDGLLSKEAELILDACQSASVFGGMGSWNDMGFDGAEQAEYERVSDQLFCYINNAIVAAVNSA